MHNILVIQLFRFGDLIQTTPAIAALRAAYPRARIHVLVRKRFAHVLHGNSDIDEVIETDIDSLRLDLADDGIPRDGCMAALRESVASLRTRQFDAVYNLSNDIPGALITYLLRPRHVAGLVFCRDRRYRVRNEWLRYLFLATEVRHLNTINLVDIFAGSCGGNGFLPKICLSNEDERYADRTVQGLLSGTERPLVGIQAGASKEHKRWPPERFAEVALRLQRAGHPLLFFGSADEREQVAGIMRPLSSPGEKSNTRALNLAGETTFSQLAALLKRCRLLISNDTATVHAAAAVGTPCLVLTFGPTAGCETAPYGEGHFVLEPNTPCFPCKWAQRCAGLPCRELLTVDAVAAALDCMQSDGEHTPEALRGRDLVLYRSEYMPDGLLGLRPLNEPPLDMRGLLRGMLRTYYLSRRLRAGHSSEPAEWRPWLDEIHSWYRIENLEDLVKKSVQAIDNFAALRKLAELGVQAANAVILHGDTASGCGDAVHRLAGALSRLEQSVLASEENDILRFLVTAFRHSLRDMEDLELRPAAVAHRWNYQRLAEGCSFMEKALHDFAHQAADLVQQPARAARSASLALMGNGCGGHGTAQPQAIAMHDRS